MISFFLIFPLNILSTFYRSYAKASQKNFLTMNEINIHRFIFEQREMKKKELKEEKIEPNRVNRIHFDSFCAGLRTHIIRKVK